MSTPPDFAYFCVVETDLTLRERYGVGSVTLARWLRLMPQSVIDARRAAIIKRRADAGRIGVASQREMRNPVGVTVTKSGPKPGSPKTMQRAADDAFVAHFLATYGDGGGVYPLPYRVAA